MLAAEIGKDLPDFTVHDVSHIDALWEMAELIAGPDYPLNPAEAFVLGGAFLVHDLGMGLAAYPGGVDDVRKQQLWSDTIVSALRRRGGEWRDSSSFNDLPPDVEREALATVLRALHAERAEHLATASWRSTGGGETYHLIEDVELRTTYGPIIGRIAHSHWWSVDRLASEFPSDLGAPGGFSNDWTIDALKLAAILRVADASHLDERRAPGFLRALRNPVGTAEAHWVFQEKLYQPRRESDRLVFTTKSVFALGDRAAWWLCFDTLQMVDKELRQVDAMLLDARRTRFLARSVAYVDSPERLAKLIQVQGWIPVDTRIRVTAVAKLVSSLGGEQLYGPDSTVPLREIIQNGSDAVRARRLLEKRDPKWGTITVRMGQDESGHWIECEDSGLGMSPRVLAGPLLDFGSSFWSSSMMHVELPGLESAGFHSTGKYGIGFFSVFMWGERIMVTSRRFDGSLDDTWILEFEQGLENRPLLRRGNREESIRDGGTRIRIWFRNEETFHRLLSGEGERQRSFSTLCARLCPTLDVGLFTQEFTEPPIGVVQASDWIEMPGTDLLRRVWRSEEPTEVEDKIFAERFGPLLRPVHDSEGNCIGRVCITPRGGSSTPSLGKGVVTVGGFRSGSMYGLAGVLLGNSERAARDVGVPYVDIDALRAPLSEQVEVLQAILDDCDEQAECAAIARRLGVHTGRLTIAYGSSGWLTYGDIRENFGSFDEILLVQDAAYFVEQRKNGEFRLHDNVLAVDVGRPGILSARQGGADWFEWPISTSTDELSGSGFWWFHSSTLKGLVIEAIAEAWNVSVTAMLNEVRLNGLVRSNVEGQHVLGIRQGLPVVLRSTVFRRPSSQA